VCVPTPEEAPALASELAPGDGLFTRGSVVRRVNAAPVLLLGGGRALLMQLAHPQVAQGVAEHSDFEADPWSRLQRTLAAVTAIVYGTEEEARWAAVRVNSVHARVRGSGYSALDPELLMWVHATLVDTALRMHARFLAPLPADEAAAYYEESKLVAELFGVPIDAQPRALSDFRAYVRHMVGTLVVSDTARRLARSVLHPRLLPLAAPAMTLLRQLTVGLLPGPLREQYGLRWNTAQQAALIGAGAGSRVALTPLRVLARARGGAGAPAHLRLLSGRLGRSAAA